MRDDTRLLALICPNECQDIACVIVEYSLDALKIISAVMLLLTAIIYTVLRKLRDLQGSCVLNFLICYVFVYSSIMYDLVLRLKWIDDVETMCPTIGYVYYFFVLSSIGWLCISVFNAWKNLVSWTSHYMVTYVVYLTVVYGGTGVIVVIQYYTSHEQSIFFKCRDSYWFDKNYEHVWFDLPIELNLGVAALLLIDCGRRSWRISANNIDNVPAIKALLKNCMICFKLYVTVSCTWIVASLSASCESSMGDLQQFLVAVQGILIFIVLILTEKKTMKLLCDSEHYGCNLFPTTWTPVNSEGPSQPRYYSQNEELTDVDLTIRPSRTVVGRRHTNSGA